MRVPRVRERIQFREVDGEAVLLDRARECMHNLNPSAACIFRAIDGARDIDAICALLQARFEVDPETALADTERVLAELEKLQVIEFPPAEGP